VKSRVPEPTVPAIRKELDTERYELGRDLDVLFYRLRWYALVPVVLAVIKQKPAKAVVRTGLRATLKLL